MKLKLKNTPEQVELIKAMGARDPGVSREATEAFAAFIGPVVQKVLLQAGTAPLIYTDNQYDEDDSPSYPLDLYYNEGIDHINVWSQNVAGGLPTSHVEGLSEMKIATYRLDTAVSMLKRYARRARLDVVSKSIERMAQEILIKQERNGWAVILKALAEASTDGNNHVVSSVNAGRFTPHDLNMLMTRIKRINISFAGGTPSNWDSRGLTDVFVSPEIMQDVRGFAYNPVSNVSSGASSALPSLPDNTREGIWNAAGMSEIYGVVLHELIELGVDKKYNVLFDNFAGSAVLKGGQATQAQGSADTTAAFGSSTGEVLVGLDLSRDAFIRPVARQSDGGGTFTALPDDQFVSRAERLGWYGFLEEGRVCLDSRAICGITV
jgi:hypothetical protein